MGKENNRIFEEEEGWARGEEKGEGVATIVLRFFGTVC